QPMIASPLHASLPSGHATENFLCARLLIELLKDTKGNGTLDDLWTKQLMRLAARIAINRTIAGLHFPVDSAAGALLGLTLSEYLIGLFTGARPYRASQFHGNQYPLSSARTGVDLDFNWERFYDIKKKEMSLTGIVTRYARIEPQRHRF